jgi:hypothetical protein
MTSTLMYRSVGLDQCQFFYRDWHSVKLPLSRKDHLTLGPICFHEMIILDFPYTHLPNYVEFWYIKKYRKPLY